MGVYVFQSFFNVDFTLPLKHFMLNLPELDLLVLLMSAGFHQRQRRKAGPEIMNERWMSGAQTMPQLRLEGWEIFQWLSEGFQRGDGSACGEEVPRWFFCWVEAGSGEKWSQLWERSCCSHPASLTMGKKGSSLPAPLSSLWSVECYPRERGDAVGAVMLYLEIWIS